LRCPQCQTENRPEVRYCETCGVLLPVSCPACGAAGSPGRTFCGFCGASFSTQSPAGPSSPEAYTPRHLAARILTSRRSLEGERKQVTVLFADVSASMELLANRDPEEARNLLDPVLTRMMEAVHYFEGTVNQVLGDGIMALFGAPLAHEDHAVRACYAALRMQDAIRSLDRDTTKPGDPPLQIRVGLNSGEVVVRSIRNDLHMDYTAVGQTTHLAARMEQMAPPGSVFLTRSSLKLAEGHVRVRPVGPLPVKGLVQAMEVYELIGETVVPSRFQAVAARGLTRFVGRGRELDVLSRALEQTRSGHGQLVALVGEPSVGKSRLVWEFTHSTRTHGCLILEAGALGYGTSPYLPLIALLKSYLKIQDSDNPEEITATIALQVSGLDEALKPGLPALHALLDVRVADPRWLTLDPQQRREQILTAIKRLLLRQSQEQPIVLVLEDLHWIDTETQAFLDTLVVSLPTARILLVVNYRPEYQHGWGGKTFYTQLRIDPLPVENSHELLTDILGRGAEMRQLKELLIERTEGNPFFLEETVRALVETGALAGERGAYSPARPIDAIEVPATVQAILAARIDRLAPEEKHVLQWAAVIGKDIPFRLLQTVANLDEETLRSELEKLQTAEFLYEKSLFPDLQYTLKHALTHEVAYGSLLQERRRALHAHIVEAMEGLYRDRLAERVEEIAQHAVRGELWERAVLYCRQAGEKAAARSAHRVAVTYFEQALTSLRHLPQQVSTVEQVIDLLFSLRISLVPLGEFERILEYLREAEALAKTINDQRRLARVCAYMSFSLCWLMGEHRAAIDSGERALAIAADLADFGFTVAPNYFVGQAYLALGDYSRAIDHLRRNAEVLVGDRVREHFGVRILPAVGSRARLAHALAELGEFAPGIAIGREAVWLAEATDHPDSLILAKLCLGLLFVRKGELEEAMALLDDARNLCTKWNLEIWVPAVAAPLGSAYIRVGRLEEAVALLERAVEQATSMRVMFGYAALVGALAEAYLLAGRIEEGRATASRSLEFTLAHEERGHEAWALRLLGEIEAAARPAETQPAESLYQKAAALARELGMRPLLAHCHVGLGRVYGDAGHRDASAKSFQTATVLFREMDATSWIARLHLGA
jgi:class 3 adenylate cyclase/tetratricopeptide (TPR) repeat protein